MPYEELFDWWIITISWSITFLIAVSIYLYRHKVKTRRSAWPVDFTFVWFLVGLLVFYVLTIGRGTVLIFAVGNIIVEVLLILYVLNISHRPETVLEQ